MDEWHREGSETAGPAQGYPQPSTPSPRSQEPPVYAMRTFVYPQGTRVRVKRGRFPVAAELVGREGTVVFLDDYRPGRYGVVLDGEEDRQDFSEDELEPTR